jgi:cytoskeletal protein CcmA (bactofilin family)
MMEDGKMADQPDDLGLPVKPVRTTPMPPVLPPRLTDLSRPVGETRPVGDSPLPTRSEQVERRTMIVGREISLSGDISSCDRLVVEGSVEANLHECHELNIAESGLFKGSASIEQDEVRGRFEGDLAVRKRLLIRASGHVSGTIGYGELEIECGGRITGSVQAHQEDVTTAYLGRVRAG